ncbi:MAG: prenyltransferase/squalene oxidase repeat-containing protein [Gemmataceae bacterium]
MKRTWLLLLSLLLFGSTRTVWAQSSATGPDVKAWKASVEKAYAYIKGRQAEDGGIAPKLGGPGITSMAVAGLIKCGYPIDDPVVAKGLKYLESNVQKDGGVYNKMLANYTTSLGVMAFKEANTTGKYDTVIANATKFLRSLQYGEGIDAKDAKFGGAGYDGKSRPDTSNTQFFVEALVASGATQNDPAVKKALAFLSRAQNLPGEYNDQPFAGKATDDDKGGFVYNHLEADSDKNPKRTANGGLRSEGGMTYAGLKSFLYAGVGKDDPRVKAAVNWVKRHYTLTENPGMGQAGLFYYFHTFAKAMAALGEDNFEDAKGVKHDWKKELFETLKAKQKDDGSWSNSNKQFLEDNPDLATCFAILALGYCK